MQLDLGFKAPLSVTELTRRIKGSLEADFADVWVQGEITGLRIPSSGHVYFALKDAGAQVRAVFFRMGSRFLKFKPEDGLEVTVRGRVSVYEPRGEYQIIVEYMEPKGLGALQLAFLQLKEKLGKEGLFDPARKRPIPAYPRAVGVVSSPTGAAIRDILKVLGRRAPRIRVVIAPASVQGEAAPDEIARAVGMLNEHAEVDVIIAGRGGGSPEDLAAFNTETVARAICASAIPVISAVGHEVDFTIADFVADLRAPTPSAAAELVAKSERETRDALTGMSRRMAVHVGQELRHARAGLAAYARALKDPMRLVRERAQRVDELSGRLTAALSREGLAQRQRLSMSARSLAHLSPARLAAATRERLSVLDGRLARGGRGVLGAHRERLGRAAVRLSAVEPLAPLARGFSLTYRLPGLDLVRDAGGVAPGDAVRVRLSRGSIDCRVEKTSEGDR